jgi:cell division transport system permease protein
VFTAMRIRTIGYFVGEALQSLRRNNWMVLASIGTVAVSLIIVGVSLITVMNANYLAARLESNIEIIAYLKGNTGEEDARALKNDIRKIPGVDKVTFISKEDALYQFRKDLGDQQNMIDALGGDNPLPHHYKVSTISPQDVGKVAVKLQGLKLIEKVDYGKGVVEKLFSVTKWVRLIGVVVMTVLALAAIFLIATTIRLTVFARKKEIQIMKILGATDWFIRWPFLMEGMVLGSIGALIAVLFVDVSYITFTNYIQKDLNFNMFGLQTDSRFMFYLGVVMVGLGAFIGVLGSGISMRKFLKV